MSDLHLPLPLFQLRPRDWLGKRLLGGLNFCLRRRRLYRDAPLKLARLIDFVREEKVDVVLSSGDHTQLGTEAEYRAARRALEPLLQGHSGFVHVPGNHDLYLSDTVDTRRFERHFADTLVTDCPEYQVDGPWPLVRLYADLAAVVAINSSHPNPQPWRASGLVPRAQLEALRQLLEDPRLVRRFVFVLTHFAPRRADGSADRRTHGLLNASDLLEVCAHLERGAILHGHIHQCYRLKLPGSGPVLYNAGSATCAGRESFWLFEIEEQRARAIRGRWDGKSYQLALDQSYPA